MTPWNGQICPKRKGDEHQKKKQVQKQQSEGIRWTKAETSFSKACSMNIYQGNAIIMNDLWKKADPNKTDEGWGKGKREL